MRALVRPGSESEPLAALGSSSSRATSPPTTTWPGRPRAPRPSSTPRRCSAAPYRTWTPRARPTTAARCTATTLRRRAAAAWWRSRPRRSCKHDKPLNEHPEVVDDVPDDPYSVSKAAAFRDGSSGPPRGRTWFSSLPAALSGRRRARSGPWARRASTGWSRRHPRSGGRLRQLSGAVGACRRRRERRSWPSDRQGLGGGGLPRFRSRGRDDDGSVPQRGPRGRPESTTGSPRSRIDPDDPEAAARYGETLVELAQRRFPVPWFDNSYTRAQLGYSPVSLREAMDETVAWLREIGRI